MPGFYNIFLKMKKQHFGAVVFDIVETAQRRPIGQRLEIWVWKKSLKYPFLPLFIILLLWVILNFWYKFPWLSMGNISKRKPFFFDSSHFILSQTLMYIGFFYHLAYGCTNCQGFYFIVIILLQWILTLSLIQGY